LLSLHNLIQLANVHTVAETNCSFEAITASAKNYVVSFRAISRGFVDRVVEVSYDCVDGY